MITGSRLEPRRVSEFRKLPAAKRSAENKAGPRGRGDGARGRSKKKERETLGWLYARRSVTQARWATASLRRVPPRWGLPAERRSVLSRSPSEETGSSPSRDRTGGKVALAFSSILSVFVYPSRHDLQKSPHLEVRNRGTSGVSQNLAVSEIQKSLSLWSEVEFFLWVSR